MAPKRAAGATARAAAAQALEKLEAAHFSGMNDAAQILDLYRKRFSGWPTANGEACALWTALDAVDRGDLPSQPVRDALLLRITEAVAAHRPPELDRADQNLGIRRAIVGALEAEDSFQCTHEVPASTYLAADDLRAVHLEEMATEKGVDLGHASDEVRERVLFYELVHNRVGKVTLARSPDLVRKSKEDDRRKHPYLLKCDTRFLKTAVPEEGYAVDGPTAEGSESEVSEPMMVDVAERAARNPGSSLVGARPRPPSAFFTLPPPLERFAEVCEGRLNTTWESSRKNAPATRSAVEWSDVSTGGDARAEGIWHALALVRLSDDLSGSSAQATRWMLVLGVSLRDKWRLAAFPIAPDRFHSFAARVTVDVEDNLSAPFESRKGTLATWRAHVRGVEVTCRSAPPDVFPDESPGACGRVSALALRGEATPRDAGSKMRPR